MHELSIALEIIDRITRLQAAEQGAAVKKVTLEVGGLSGVDAGALELAFPVAVEGTPFTATLWDIQPVTAAVQCHDCGKESEPDTLFPVCMLCGSTEVEIVRGRELLIGQVELETNHV